MEKRRGRVIGLTGNIACGKSTVARRLATYVAEVIDADQVARRLMLPDQPAWQATVAAFGPEILNADRTINRAKLGAIVFSDAQALLALNAATHPHVHAELLGRIATLPPDQVAVIEAVALVEAGMHREVDAFWLVLSRPEQQIARLVATRGLTPDQAALRVRGQPSAEAKIPLADEVLQNDGSLEALLRATDEAWERTLARWREAEGQGATYG